MEQLIAQLQGKRHVVWDWNGTLLNDVDHCINVMQQLLREYRLPPLTKERYRDIFEFPVINYYKTLGFDFEQYPFIEVAHKFVDSYMSDFHRCNLHPSARTILQTTRGLFPCQSILSATDQESLNEMISHFELSSYFDYWFGISDKLAASKIERGFELMEQAGYPKSETVLIGDTDHDIDVGAELGIDVLLVAHGHHSFNRLTQKHRSDRVLPTFS